MSMQTENTQTETRDDDDALLARIADIAQLVESGDVNLDEMRGHYSATYGKETVLDDDGIIGVIAASEDDHDAKGWAGMMREAEVAETAQAALATPEASHDKLEVAHRLGDKIASNVKVSETFSALIAAKELDKRGVAEIFFNLNDVWSADDWGNVPVPGSKKGETGNQPYDIWFVPDLENNTKVKFSFFEQVALRFGYYRNTVQELSDVSDTLLTVPKLETTAAQEFMKERTKPWRQAHKATLSYRKSAFLQTIKKASGLKKKLDEIDSLPGVRVQLLTETNPDRTKSVQRTTAPIELSHADKPSMCSTYTVGSFMRLDGDKALANSGGNEDAVYKALIDTLTRAPKNKGKATAGDPKKYPPAQGVEDLENIMSELSTFLDIDDKAKRDNFVAFGRWFKVGTQEEREEKVKNFSKLYLAVSQVWNRGVKQVYEEIEARESKVA